MLVNLRLLAVRQAGAGPACVSDMSLSKIAGARQTVQMPQAAVKLPCCWTCCSKAVPKQRPVPRPWPSTPVRSRRAALARWRRCAQAWLPDSLQAANLAEALCPGRDPAACERQVTAGGEVADLRQALASARLALRIFFSLNSPGLTEARLSCHALAPFGFCADALSLLLHAYGLGTACLDQAEAWLVSYVESKRAT